MHFQRVFVMGLLPFIAFASPLSQTNTSDIHIERRAALLDHLVPVYPYKYGFTAAGSISTGPLTTIPLSDGALGVHRAQSNLPKPIVTPPWSSSPSPPITAYQATYPKGSINPSGAIPGGFGFYVRGENTFASQLAQGGTREAVMSYRLMLEKGWQWRKGGKLPGVFGGEGGLAFGCTGGRQTGRCRCFDIRVMWRADGQGELYTYLPTTKSNDAVLMSVPPRSIRNNDYGYSVGRGSFSLSSAIGNWVTLALRVRLNQPWYKDGEIQLFVDGKSVIHAKGLVIRGNGGETGVCDGESGEGSRLQGGHFQTFFGGNSEEWASPRDQRAWFSDITGVIVE